MSNIIGIDLGTTFSAIAKLDDHGQPAIVSVDGHPITASCVFAPKADEGAWQVGDLAVKFLDHEPESIVKRFKRDMGGDTVYHLRSGLSLTPVVASVAVLKKLTQEAAKQLGPIDEVVITVPANFGEHQRKATIEAGELAGLKVTNIINEPTAAVLAYAAKRRVSGTVMIYDLGGGTFDVTIAKVNGSEVECLTSKGDSNLGGMDFDQKIAELIDQKYAEKYGRTLRAALGIQDSEGEQKSTVWQGLLRDAEECKKTLSKMTIAPFSLRNGPDGPLMTQVTRQEFERAISGMIAQTEMCVETALDNIDLSHEDIDEVLLVGGSSRVPAVRNSLNRIFGKQPSEAVNPDEVVALGAAIYAGLRKGQGSLKPMQREALSGISLVDVANHYYGTIALHSDEELEKCESRVTVIIPKNTPIPCSRTETFYTVVAGQRFVRCRVTQSGDEEEDPDFVKVILDDDQLGPLPPGRPRGQPIEVTYSYDENQIMHASFKDLNSGMIFERELKLSDGVGSATSVPDFRID